MRKKVSSFESLRSWWFVGSLILFTTLFLLVPVEATSFLWGSDEDYGGASVDGTTVIAQPIGEVDGETLYEVILIVDGEVVDSTTTTGVGQVEYTDEEGNYHWGTFLPGGGTVVGRGQLGGVGGGVGVYPAPEFPYPPTPPTPSPPSYGSPGGGSAYTPAPTCYGCRIGGICYDNGAVNPNNVCQYCDRAKSTTSWSYRPEGYLCSGNNHACTADGRCTPIEGGWTDLVYPKGNFVVGDSIEFKLKGVFSSHGFTPHVECKLIKYDKEGNKVGEEVLQFTGKGDAILSYTVKPWPEELSGVWKVGECRLWKSKAKELELWVNTTLTEINVSTALIVGVPA